MLSTAESQAAKCALHTASAEGRFSLRCFLSTALFLIRMGNRYIDSDQVEETGFGGTLNNNRISGRRAGGCGDWAGQNMPGDGAQGGGHSPLLSVPA